MNAQGVLPQGTTAWKTVWTPQYYEPDLMVSTAYGGGALFQYDGWLYFGTMHVPNKSEAVHESCSYRTLCFGEPQTPEEETILYNGTYRYTSVWRAKNLEARRRYSFFMARRNFPKFNYRTRTFDMTPNVRGYVPLYGSSGFGSSRIIIPGP